MKIIILGFDASGSFRVLRGGGCYYGPVFARVAYSYRGDPGGRDGSLGLRLILGVR